MFSLGFVRLANKYITVCFSSKGCTSNVLLKKGKLRFYRIKEQKCFHWIKSNRKNKCIRYVKSGFWQNINKFKLSNRFVIKEAN